MFPYSILVESHCCLKLTFSDDHHPPRSSPPAAPTTLESKVTTGGTVLVLRIHPGHLEPTRSHRSPATIAGILASARPEEEEGGRPVKPDQWARRAHCQ